MNEYVWPAGSEVPAPNLVRESWEATVAALPAEARITGEVIGRQRFGVFIRIDGVANAIALAEITAMPHRMDLPALGSFVNGQVLGHAAHIHQVKVRLDEWLAADK